MENTPITQEIFFAFMKCLNQYDFENVFPFEKAEEQELKPDQEIFDNCYYQAMRQLENLKLI